MKIVHVTFVTGAILLGVAAAGTVGFIAGWRERPVSAPPAPVAAIRPSNAALAVAGVFGRAPRGCRNAQPGLIFLVTDVARRHGLEPRLLAATIAVESSCDPLVVSFRGALGLMQVVPRVHMKEFDLTGRYNLLNPVDNLEVGATILADLVKRHGLVEGLRRYNGTGKGCATCDGRYTPKVLELMRGGK